MTGMTAIKQDNGDGRCPPSIAIGEALQIKLVGNHVGAIVTACHHAHDIEQLQTEDNDSGDHREEVCPGSPGMMIWKKT